MDFRETFKANLERLIRMSGLSMREFAEKVGTSSASISRWLNTDRIPDLATIVPICQKMGVSVDWIFGLQGESYGGITDEQREVLDLYIVATEDDRRVIDAVLSKYRKRG